MKSNLRDFSFDLAGITIGAVLCGLGFSLFLIPYKASPGGVGGLAQIFFYLFNLPAGIAMLMFNIPLFIIGLITFGKSFGFKTIYAIIAVSVFTDIFSTQNLIDVSWLKPYMYQINDSAYSFTDVYLLAVIAGSLILGAGLGVVIKYNGSTGGTDIPALLLRKHFGISIGNSYLIIDTLIIFLIGIVFEDPNLILWGMLSLFISSKICDNVIEGFASTRGVIIKSSQPELVKEFIQNNFSRKVIRFSSNDENSNEIVYSVVSRRELISLKKNMRKIDPSSSLIVSHVHETMGNDIRKE